MQPTRRSTLFLMELIMAILLFSLAAAVCVQVFVKSHTIEKESTALTKAVFASSSVAEIFRSSDDYEELLLAEFPQAISENDGYLIYYDEDFSPVVSDGTYCLKFTTDTEDNFVTGHISVYPSSGESDVIYELDLKKYCAKEEE